jgi:SAM-dependent methyltransferase
VIGRRVLAGLAPARAEAGGPATIGRRVLAGLALASAVAAASGCSSTPGVVAPYVQTPDDVVLAMLRLAGVGPADMVYDLGSGDGRIVIAAARHFGARGVGVELEPRLVAESRELARRAGVGERTEFRQQDIFVTDLGPATVVTVYLSPELNLRLRPRFLAQLRSGSRIVSHDFLMGDWNPARTITVRSPDRTHTLHLWTVP